MACVRVNVWVHVRECGCVGMWARERVGTHAHSLCVPALCVPAQVDATLSMVERSGLDVVSFLTGDNLPPVSDVDLSQMTLLIYFKDVTAYETSKKGGSAEHLYFGGKSGGGGSGTTGFAIFANIVSKGGTVHASPMHMVYEENLTTAQALPTGTRLGTLSTDSASRWSGRNVLAP